MSAIHNKHDEEATREEQKNFLAPDVERETRFAVVMYGGVSLAIYIFGVTKELYSMVKATARKRGEGGNSSQGEYLLELKELTDVEKIYRQVGKILGTKFVVDILSGTSAGGINAVFLAKALANGQRLDRLKNVWLEEGDINKLINDKDSIVRGLELQNPPRSLLNSHRMYFHLLKALHEMDEKENLFSSLDGLSPFVDELDLNITATDIRGLPVDLPVSNSHVQEIKYRNVFRFHYSTMEAAGREAQEKSEKVEKELYSNDFVQKNNPFLAYAARCTSSFPVAFEPMQLEDILDVLSLKEFKKYSDLKLNIWRGYFKGYDENAFSSRSFGDGGYIDNKPFSYATEALVRRIADVPVDRKLIYIDPSPEHPDVATKNGQRPDALENVLAATMSIPRYEPIREDLEKVVDRNRLIKRVNEVISHIDFVPALRKELKPWQKDTTKWANKFFDKELLEWFGVSYATYHQLRVASVLEDFQVAMLRAMNLEESGTQAEAFHVLMEGWRRHFYSIRPDAPAECMSENDILFRLDTTWRMRRVIFLQNLINRLLKGLTTVGEGDSNNDANQILAQSGVQKNVSTLNAEKSREELLTMKRELNEAYGHLRARGRKVRSRNLIEKTDLDDDLKQYVSILAGIKRNISEDLTRLASETNHIAKTSEKPSSELLNVFQQIEDASVALSGHLAKKDGKRTEKGYIHKSLSYAGKKVKGALGHFVEKKGKEKRTVLQQCLTYYHDRFEYYDMLIFPIYYGTDVGESDETEIIRISPEDGKNLVDDKTGKRKLAGTTLMNFGAFFAKDWRENDMLWGRLDAAECVIKAIMPDNAERAALIDEVQSAILKEDLTSRDEAQVYETDKAAKGAKLRLDEKQEKSLKVVLDRLAQPGKMLSMFKKTYRVDKSFPPKETLSASARALRVFSNLLDDLSATHKQFSTPAKWLTSASSIFAGILAVVLPNSIGNFLVAGYWVWLLYIFELLLFGVGWLIGVAGIAQLGIALFALTFISHLLLRAVNRSLSGQPASLRFIALVVAGILGIGALVLILFLIYMGLISLGWWSLPSGALGDWLSGLAKGK